MVMAQISDQALLNYESPGAGLMLLNMLEQLFHFTVNILPEFGIQIATRPTKAAFYY